MGLIHYMLNGKTVTSTTDLMEWAKWMETANRRVAETTINEIWVSTVFLGLDHGFGSDDPLLFETMVFFPAGETGNMRRYFTWEEAEAGHAEIVAAIENSNTEAELLTVDALKNLMEGVK